MHAPPVSAEGFSEVARAYADRLYDDLRRLGLTSAEAAGVVEESAVELVDRVRAAPRDVGDLAGAWFRLARETAGRLLAGADREPDPTLAEAGSTGIVHATEDDRQAREALARLPDVDREALLLRDAYDLPYGSVAVALGIPPERAGETVAAARMRFAGLDVPAGHGPDLGRLALSADGVLAAPERRAAERHAAHCPTCKPAAPALREVRRRLSGLALLAFPEPERDTALARIGSAARRVLPPAAQVLAEPVVTTYGPAARTVAASIGIAAVLGLVVGVGMSTDGGGGSRARGGFVDRTFDPDQPSATPTPSPTPTPTPTASPTPTPTLTSARPSPTRTDASPTPSESTDPTPVAYDPSISLSPTSGRNCTSVRVSGRGWPPDRSVSVTYRDVTGSRELNRTTARTGPTGRFQVFLRACDGTGLPGPHVVRAAGGGYSAQQTFTATA